jgi:hypothetical protein
MRIWLLIAPLAATGIVIGGVEPPMPPDVCADCTESITPNPGRLAPGKITASYDRPSTHDGYTHLSVDARSRCTKLFLTPTAARRLEIKS